MSSSDLSGGFARTRDASRWLFWLALIVAAAVAVIDLTLGARVTTLLAVAACVMFALLAVRLRADQERDARRLALQYEVARILSEAETPTAAGPELLAAIAAKLGFEAGNFWVAESPGVLRCGASWQTVDVDPARFRRVSPELALRPGFGLPGEALQRGRPTWLRDMAADASFPRVTGPAPGGVAFPVRTTAGVVGVIELFAERLREPDAELTALMAALGGSIGEFVEARRAGSVAREREAQLEAILRGVADGITVQAADGSLLFANDAAVRSLGFETREQLLEAPIETIMNGYELLDEDGGPFPLERLPGRVALAGGEPAEALVRFRDRGSGEEQWAVVKATPVLAGDGAVTMAINVIEDVTSVKRAEARQRFLAQASAVLSSSLDRDETLRAIVSLVVPEVADWCAIDLLDHDGGGERIALGDAGTESRDGRQTLAVPIISRDRSLGSLTLALGPSGRHFDAHDRELAQELGSRCATALDNARLYSERTHIARTLQRSLLPVSLPAIPGLESAARFRPIGDGVEVGGDFYDLFASGGRGWTVVMGDVCGKGPEAAAVTALTRYTLRTAAMRERLPSRILRLLNEALLAQRDDQRFCTVAYAYLETAGTGAELVFAAGGHPLPLLLRADGSVEEVGEPGTLLGVVPDPTLADHSAALAPGDAIVFYTDGVTDGRGGALSEDTLKRLVESCAGESADAIAATIEGAAVAAQNGVPSDDIAVLVLRVHPERPRAG
ncbi:MAG TPA: SpoIIE family protein phosphatase [Thermoleophilaceae bacterium]